MKRKNTERFSDRVENYVKYRPKYPKEFVDYLYTSIGFSKDAIVADIGSGTGILTALLLDRGCRVVGVEPNKEMRKAAETLLEEYPKFVSMDGTAETTGLASSSVDYIICAQAFHWFDKDACKKEFQKILKPNGKVVLAWNKRKVEETGFSAEYEELVRTYANDYNEVNHNLITEAEFRVFFKNGVYHKAVFSNKQIFDFEGLKGRLLSSSYTPMPGEQNYEPLLAELKKLFDKYEVNGSVAFEYETEVYIGEV
jgi:SAM-dependent methyltransferase